MSTVKEILEAAAVESVRNYYATRNNEVFTLTDLSPQNVNEWLEYADNIPAYDSSVSFVEHHGGEGQGDEYWFVYKITHNATGDVRYAKIEARWVSWDGVYWDEAEIFEVWPKEVVKTEWSSRKP